MRTINLHSATTMDG